MSRLDPSYLFADLSVRCSPVSVSGWRGGSIPTLWHISVRNSAVVPQIIVTASTIAQNHDKTYSKTLHCIRCKLSYSLLHSAIMCLRGARSSIHHPTTSLDTMDLACHESWVPLHWTEPTYTQTPCIYSLHLLYLHLIDLVFHCEKKKTNSMVAKMDFRGG